VRRRLFESEIEAIASKTWESWFIQNPEAAIAAVRLVLAGERPAFDLTPCELARVRELAGIEQGGAHAAP
jgi:hypothetical protein